MPEPIFYFSVPQGDRTGGPECLHQLANAVIQRGYRSILVPMRGFRGRQPDSEYDIYKYETAERIEDPNSAVLVVGEVSPIESAREIRQVPTDRTWLWWLSVHNGPDPRSRYFRGSPSCCTFEPQMDGIPRDSLPALTPHRKPVHKTYFADASTAGLIKEAYRRTVADYSPSKSPRTFAVESVSLMYNRRFIESPVGMLAQSVYAQGFCQTMLGRDALPMTDYLRRPEITAQPLNPNLVLYNGAKGYSMIRELAPLMPDVDFQPIEGMSYLQVCEALSSAAAYVELGVPPGRDRLPREAAHFGTPSVLLCRGSAYCWDDFPLPAQYRIPHVDNWAQLLAPALETVLRDRERALADQAFFRDWVAGDRQRYEAEVDAWLEQASGAF